ncbi:MAG: hypothetical protein KY464_10670 [Gemmatimonadetes bacterium]|nr:hypothetical protein [Gemmatimonadota bacterium]
MSTAEGWLRARVSGAPPELLSTMIAALPNAPGAVPDALAGGALSLYARVANGSGGREDALPLLAADALLTHAFEAQAELDPAGLEALAIRWGARGALGEVSS